jgi:hypothetical protein
VNWVPRAALSMDAQPVSALALKAGADDDAAAALGRLQHEHFAIAGDGCYELTGPLSWFGDFTSAIAGRLAAIAGTPLSAAECRRRAHVRSHLDDDRAAEVRPVRRRFGVA